MLGAMNHVQGIHGSTSSPSFSHVFLFTRKFESNVPELHSVTPQSWFQFVCLCKEPVVSV